MPVFRLLHASDLHIAARPRLVGLPDLPAAGVPWPGFPRLGRASSHDPDALEALASFAWERRSRLDAVVLSGDLATTGAVEDLSAARGFVHDEAAKGWLARSSRPTLRGCGRPVFLLPGNHDRFQGWALSPGGTAFDQAFREDWGGGQSAQLLAVLEKAGSRLGLVGLDLSLRPGEDATALGGLWGQGRAYPEVVDGAEAISRRLAGRYPGIVLLWVAHFPPRFPGANPALDLRQAEILVEGALAAGVRAILAGHTHAHREYAAAIEGGSVPVLCAGSASQQGERDGHFLHLVEVEPGAKVAAVRRRSLRFYAARAAWIEATAGAEA